MLRLLLVLPIAALTIAVAFTDTYHEPDWDQLREQQNRILQELEQPLSPPDEYAGNPVDWFLYRWYEEHSVEIPGTLTDARFLRRASLDAIGLLPSPESVEAIGDISHADTRSEIIDSLLDNDQAYSEHWITFWNDLLRNDEQTNIDGLRQPITTWLYGALKENRPYDIMVTQLLNPAPEGGSGGFLKGVNWRGRINASQKPVIQAAQNVGQVFLATPLKCASCHNHFTKEWTLEDTYALAACFSEDNELELVRCDKPTGQKTGAGFPLPGLGSIDPEAELYERRGQAAKLVISPENPRFARTMVNRIWHRLMGRGLFEPIDDLDGDPLYPELLDWLSYDFMANGYCLKHTIRQIMTSEAYARVACSETVGETRPSYGSPAVRRMQSEQLFDAIYTVCGFTPDTELKSLQIESSFVRAWRHRKPGVLATALGRPNREQVVSARELDATVLQMLELVNGDEFAIMMKQAATHVCKRWSFENRDDEALVEQLFVHALSREPKSGERTVLLDGFSDATTDEAYHSAVEDTLWMIFMHPEFQFIL